MVMITNKKNHRKRFLNLIGTFFIFIILSGCTFSSKLEKTKTDSLSLYATPSVEVEFILEVYQALTDGDSIVLEILDEVTGLEHYIYRYPMSMLDDEAYNVKLSFPSGSVINYRYIKIGDGIKKEATLWGIPVDFRLFVAQNSGKITDLLQAWEDETHNQVSGMLSGSILEHETDLPIPDIIVGAGGQLTFTDSNGKFLLTKLSTGLHNVVFYAPDGQYQTHQQGASIAAGLTTPAEVKMTRNQPVNITFKISPPNEALGAPIYIAGNFVQLGNSYTNLPGSMRIKPKRMPAVLQDEDGTFSTSIQLYSGTDLRFLFTLGDGYWNAEQKFDGSYQIRQLIIPDHDITLSLDIDTWRSPEIEPITFQIVFPPDSSPLDEKFIQFKITDWTEPIPLWPIGNANYLYILFSPLDENFPVSYRFCRNANCQQAANFPLDGLETSVLPKTTSQIIAITVDNWLNWTSFNPSPTLSPAYIPQKNDEFSTMVELTPEMNPSWLTYAPIGLSNIAQLPATRVIISPQWHFNPDTGVILPLIGVTPYQFELVHLVNNIQTLGYEHSLYPQIGPVARLDLLWSQENYTTTWWDTYFKSYRLFILSYAQLARNTGAEQLIIGGKHSLPAFPGGMLPNGIPTNLDGRYDVQWLNLIKEIRAIYNGRLIWATNINLEMDPLPAFIDLFDGIYIIVDSPLATSSTPSSEEIASEFTRIMDQYIYEAYRSTSKPIFLAFGYPSVEGAARGCALVSPNCYNDGLFLTEEIAAFPYNTEEQAMIYNSILPIIASRDWISGISIRGYDPAVTLHLGHSSIAGKPAEDVIKLWFTGILQ